MSVNTENTKESTLTIQNGTANKIQLIWLDFEGEEKM